MPETPVISYLTMKGGVGKTTLAANLTRAIAEVRTAKILLIDTDAQCNLSQVFCEPDQIENKSNRSILQAFETHKPLGPSDLKTQIYKNSGNGSSIDLIMGSFETFPLSFSSSETVRHRAEATFKNFMKMARNEYDLIFMDTNPSATFVTMQALNESNFLIAPITFDAFSMRGVHLIVDTLQGRYNWLSNPRRIRIIPNKIPRPHNDAARARLLAEEEAVRNKFPNLNQSITLERIHESKFFANRNPQQGFVVDRRVLPMHWNALSRVSAELSAAGKSMRLSLDEAFPHEAKNQESITSTVGEQYSSEHRQPAERPFSL